MSAARIGEAEHDVRRDHGRTDHQPAGDRRTIGVTAWAGLLAVGVGSALLVLVARRTPAATHRD